MKYSQYTTEQLIERLRGRENELDALKSAYSSLFGRSARKTPNAAAIRKEILKREHNLERGNDKLRKAINERRGYDMGSVFGGESLRHSGIMTK